MEYTALEIHNLAMEYGIVLNDMTMFTLEELIKTVPTKGTRPPGQTQINRQTEVLKAYFLRLKVDSLINLTKTYW
jgi:hypothetical protein